MTLIGANSFKRVISRNTYMMDRDVAENKHDNWHIVDVSPIEIFSQKKEELPDPGRHALSALFARQKEKGMIHQYFT